MRQYLLLPAALVVALVGASSVGASEDTGIGKGGRGVVIWFNGYLYIILKASARSCLERHPCARVISVIGTLQWNVANPS
jgi:hypothetical protein